MTLAPGLRKVALVAHVISSVGWFGAVAGFLALAVAGLTGHEAQTISAAYFGMELTGWFVIVPLSLVSLLTGLVSALGTTWGLFRHYWVVAKLIVTVPATVLLLVHMQPIGRIARITAETPLSAVDLVSLRVEIAAESGAALIVLFLATALSVYKPRGMTPYGWRKQHEQRVVPQ